MLYLRDETCWTIGLNKTTLKRIKNGYHLNALLGILYYAILDLQERRKVWHKLAQASNLWIPRYTEGLLRRLNYFAGPSIIKSPSLSSGKVNSFTRNFKLTASDQCEVFMQLEALHVPLSVAALGQ